MLDFKSIFEENCVVQNHVTGDHLILFLSIRCLIDHTIYGREFR